MPLPAELTQSDPGLLVESVRAGNRAVMPRSGPRMADSQPTPADPGPQPEPEPVPAPKPLPAEYLRADEELLVESIELGEPYDPANTIET